MKSERLPGRPPPFGRPDLGHEVAGALVRGPPQQPAQPPLVPQQELRDALNEFTRAARSMRVFLDYLERHPESPIRGKLEDKSVAK